MNTTIKIHVLHTGQVQVDQALPFQEKSINPLAYTGLFRSKQKQILLPVSAYLIEHPKGLVLIDTGWHTHMRQQQIKYMGRLHHLINKAVLPEGQAIHEQLARLHIQPKDLDFVVLSHLHGDHVSGLKLVKDAKQILVSEEEWLSAQQDKLRYIHHMWEGVQVNTFQMIPSSYGPQQRSFDLFGDDSIVFIHTPGHTKGLTTTMVKRDDRFVLLASDVGYASASWEQMILPSIMTNREQVIQSLQWIKQNAESPYCIKVIANHDVEIQPHVIEL